MITAVAAQHGSRLRQIDIKTACFNALLQKEMCVHARPPEGLEQLAGDPGRVLAAGIVWLQIGVTASGRDQVRRG